MSKMQIFEPAMCCSTGLCGVSIDPELLRISTVLSSLEKNGIKVARYNLTNAPQEFINNRKVNQLIMNDANSLPAIVLDGEIVITRRYPTNDEFVSLMNVPRSYLSEKPSSITKVKVTPKKTEGCGCSDGKCC